MSNVDLALRWSDIATRASEIARNAKTKSKHLTAIRYSVFADEMCRVCCDRAVREYVIAHRENNNPV